jgi:hypothetical protein
MLNRVRVLAAILPLAALLSGCLYEATIDAKGGAEVKVHYRVDPNTKLDKVARDLQSKDVTLVSKSMDKDHYIDATLQTADVMKLPTTTYFRATTIGLVDGPDKGTKKLSIRYANKTPNVKIPPNALDYYGTEIKIALNLPGEVVASNATETKGTSATWTFDTTKFFAAKETTLEVTYKLGK